MTKLSGACSPNCEVRTVSAEGVRRVVLVSLREIRYKISCDATMLDVCISMHVLPSYQMVEMCYVSLIASYVSCATSPAIWFLKS